MDEFHIVLEARDPNRNIFRSYSIEAGRDLFGEWLIEIRYGRIGNRGHHVRYSAVDEKSAKRLVLDKLKRRASARKRIGVAYQITELHQH